MPTKDEFYPHGPAVRANAERTPHDRAVAVQEAAAVAVNMRFLTEDAHWNRFLAILQNALQIADKQTAEITAVLGRRTAFAPGELDNFHRQLIQCATVRDTLTWVMETPKALISGASRGYVEQELPL